MLDKPWKRENERFLGQQTEGLRIVDEVILHLYRVSSNKYVWSKLLI